MQETDTIKRSSLIRNHCRSMFESLSRRISNDIRGCDDFHEMIDHKNQVYLETSEIPHDVVRGLSKASLTHVLSPSLVLMFMGWESLDVSLACEITISTNLDTITMKIRIVRITVDEQEDETTQSL